MRLYAMLVGINDYGPEVGKLRGAINDVGHYRGGVLEPGVVLTVDPQFIVPEERLYIRVEDTVVMTEASQRRLA